MKIDVRKIESMESLINKSVEFEQKLEIEGELFLFKDNQPKMVVMTVDRYNSLTQEDVPEFNLENIRAGKFSARSNNSTWGRKWDIIETKATLYYYLVICSGNPSYELVNSDELKNFVSHVNSYMNNKRSINSFALKIQNFQSLNKNDSRTGLINASNQDKKIWAECSHNIEQLKSLYDQIMKSEV